MTVGSARGQRRRVVVLGCYIPPNYDKKKGEDTLNYISDTVTEIKRRYNDPQIIIAGDFNQWKIGEALLDFSDLKEVDVGRTRGNRAIDRIFLNMSRSVTESGSLEPLQTDKEDGDTRSSNHRVAYCRLALPKTRSFTWQTYTYRFFNEQAKDGFRAWMVLHDWQEVLGIRGSNNKTMAYQETLTNAMDRFFPWKTTRRKSNDLPWINKRVVKEIADRKKLFWQEGGKRTAIWKQKKKETDELIKNRKANYRNVQKDHLLAKDANRNFIDMSKLSAGWKSLRSLMSGSSFLARTIKRYLRS